MNVKHTNTAHSKKKTKWVKRREGKGRRRYIKQRGVSTGDAKTEKSQDSFLYIPASSQVAAQGSQGRGVVSGPHAIAKGVW